jgi:diguanylate cyclase (GGDEF)-like protein/putative nucleotidyltransferase with HDIG domain
MNWAELPAKLRIYISFLSVLGILIAVWAIWDIATKPYNPFWLVLTLLVIITVPFSLFLESVSSAVGIGDAYIMAIAMIYGVAPCILATFCQSFIISLFGQRQRRYTYRIIFNTASTVCGAWLYGTIYHLILNGSSELQNIIVSAAFLVATYFFVNSFLTSVAIAWSLNQSIIKFWAQACMPLAVDYSISSLCATFLVALNKANQFYLLTAAPAILMAWIWNKYQESQRMKTEKHLTEQKQLYLRTVESLALAVDAKDQTTYGHIRRVKVYAIGLAKLCGIKDESELNAIETGSLLHDIGKLAIDDYILNKPGRLSQKEFEKIKVHTTAGDEILQQVCFPFPVAKYVRYHHERWDGLGYPDGLKGQEIPLGARILAIADAFDAIRNSRPYKLSVETEEAIEILRAQSGTVYDPYLVRIFSDHIHDLEHAAIKESENAPQLSFRGSSGEPDKPPVLTSNAAPSIPDIPAELIQLAEFCTTMSGYLDLNDFLTIISRRLNKLVPFSTCAFFLNQGDDWISAKYVYGRFSDLLQGFSMEIGKGISGWVAAYRKPMINTGPALDFQGLTGDFSLYTDAIVVPILETDECFGTISLYAEKPISYGQHELKIVETVASFLAPVISELRKTAFAESYSVIDATTSINRISYLTTIGPQLISTARQNRTTISLIYIEIRNIDQIIRILGSNYANTILRRVADCIKPELRETDILVRYGYQGFVAFLPGVRNGQALRCAQRLKQQIKTAVMAPSQGFTIDSQTGVSYYPKDGTTVLDLLKSARENMLSSLPDKSSSEKNVLDFYRP